MKLTLKPETLRLIEDRVSSGRYTSAEEVIAAALNSLTRDERGGDFEPGEWDKLLAEGERSGEPLDGEAVLAELRDLRARHQSKAG